jgi:hypothetical protein
MNNCLNFQISTGIGISDLIEEQIEIQTTEITNLIEEIDAASDEDLEILMNSIGKKREFIKIS